jgi:4-hydroxy-3-methylbut-2-enyl diphosphate reductase
MSLVVLAPLRLEAFALTRGLRDPGTKVVRTGMGPTCSRAAARQVTDCYKESSAVAVAGLCGGVAAGLRPGDVVVATAVRRESGADREVPDAAVLAAAVRELGLRYVTGTILSVERLARTARRAAEGHDDVVAVDMESAWLAEGAGERPVAVLRVVADAGGRSVYHPRTLVDGTRALSVLRRAAPALESWARAAARDTDTPLSTPQDLAECVRSV